MVKRGSGGRECNFWQFLFSICQSVFVPSPIRHREDDRIGSRGVPSTITWVRVACWGFCLSRNCSQRVMMVLERSYKQNRSKTTTENLVDKHKRQPDRTDGITEGKSSLRASEGCLWSLLQSKQHTHINAANGCDDGTRGTRQGTSAGKSAPSGQTAQHRSERAMTMATLAGSAKGVAGLTSFPAGPARMDGTVRSAAC